MKKLFTLLALTISFSMNAQLIQSTTASGAYSTAMGDKAQQQVEIILQQWENTQQKAAGDYSTAMGRDTEASGKISTAMGAYTTASGDYSTAMGRSTTASGNYSTAMGAWTTASGYRSTAMGITQQQVIMAH